MSDDEAEAILSTMREDQQHAIGEYLMSLPNDVMALRERQQPEFPWPSRDNPMLAYLITRANALKNHGAPAQLVWLAVHAWFEGALAALSINSDAEPTSSREAAIIVMRRMGLVNRRPRTWSKRPCRCLPISVAI